MKVLTLLDDWMFAAVNGAFEGASRVFFFEAMFRKAQARSIWSNA
jgi:hypothetical protein